MAEVPNNPAQRPELRPAAPHQGGPLGSSGAAPSSPPTATPPAATPPAGADAKTPDAKTLDAETAGTKATDAKTAGTKTSGAGDPAPADAASKDAAVKKDADATAGSTTASSPTVAGATTTPADPAKPDAPQRDGTKPDAAKADGSKPDAAKADGSKAAGGKKRRFRPLHATGRAARAVGAWAKGPSGRLVIPGVLVAGLVVGAGTAGVYLVPKALEAAPAPSATPNFGSAPVSVPPPVWGSAGAPGAPGAPGLGVSGPPSYPVPGATIGGGLPGVTTGTGLPGVTQPATTGIRPADALASWASQVGTQVGIPVVAVQAYGYAELVTARTTPGCHLNWTTLAAIGQVESAHGSHNGAVLGADGVAEPKIYGLPLDGRGGRQLIADTDRGVLDQDTTYDRAIGPMQFIPATWQESAIDADRNGVTDPNDIDDAAMTAAAYLCKGGRDLARADSWWDAILSYNAVRPYAEKVFTTADEYGRRSQ
ncbi:lytic murein transglycosylase [Actinoplanes utahensis]|uniref:lytic murein transglycosylase n=1 Tax=Actinoplanes utahensis TaxID=1869 RepID=UPI0031ED5ABE